MKKTNYLNSQGLEQFKLSRREFCLCTSALAFSGILHETPASQSTQILNAANIIGIDNSTKRVGEWMRKNISTKKSIQIVREAEERLKSTSLLSKNAIRGLISSDYSQGRTVDISSIRFSILEVALCITASTCAS
jgi:hypothetical protein